MITEIVLVLTLCLLTLQQHYCNVNSETYPEKITKGKQFVVCVHFTTIDGTEKKAAFAVIIDEYTGLELVGVYEQIVKQEAVESYLSIQSQNSASDSINKTLFYQNGKVAQLYSFVFIVKNGVLQRIEDDNSAFCDKSCSSCISYSATTQHIFKNCFVNSSSNSDPKIFVSWMGTDSNNEYLLSHTQRISKFTQYSISDVFAAALSIF